MKKDRNCGSPYPIYPAYQGMPYMPNMPMMGPVPFGSMTEQVPNTGGSTSSTTNQTFNNLQEQINLLDKRITNLESMMNTNTMTNQYSSSNYQMM